MTLLNIVIWEAGGENTKTKNSVVKVIENCGHTFRNKEKELAQVILDFVK